MFSICSLHVQYLFRTCSVFVPNMFSICSKHVQYLFRTCLVFVHYIYSVHAQYMFRTCSVLVPYIFSICSVNVQCVQYLTKSPGLSVSWGRWLNTTLSSPLTTSPLVPSPGGVVCTQGDQQVLLTAATVFCLDISIVAIYFWLSIFPLSILSEFEGNAYFIK
jgi:hypothetical protein